MANKTSIEWTDYNWNFLRGCSRVSEGCRNCYAEGVAARFSGDGMPYEGLAKFVDHKPRWTGEISFHDNILLEPLKWKNPRKVFVNSMSDLFHEKVTDEMLNKAFRVMFEAKQHTFQILTKRPERMLKYVGDRWVYGKGKVWEPAPNIWLGVSVEDQETANKRIPILLNTPASVRWISAEPLLGEIDLSKVGGDAFGWGSIDALIGFSRVRANALEYGCEWEVLPCPKLDWVVVGGESGPNARVCKREWIQAAVNQCKRFDVPVFVKQLGANTTEGYLRNFYRNKKGGDISEFPEDLQIREFPVASNAVATATAS